jgi:polyhydroxyalkanoate synthesis regulator phasin
MSVMTTITELREFMEGALGKLSPAKAQDLAKSIMQGQGKGKDQVQKVAHDLMDWSNKNRQRLTDVVRGEVSSQLSSLGVATQSDLDALKRRVRELERGQTAAKKRTTAKRSTAKRTPATPEATPTPAAPVTPTAGA